MNEKPTNSSPKDLSGRTVAIIFSIVGAVLIITCLAVGAWPLAVGCLIAPLLLLIFVSLSNFLGRIFIGIPLLLLGRILPNKFTVFATTKKLHPIIVILIFLGLFGILLIVFRSLIGVIGGLAVVGFLLGLPWLADWSRRRKSKKPSVNPPSEPGNK
jgi:hypothetical protein